MAGSAIVQGVEEKKQTHDYDGMAKMELMDKKELVEHLNSLRAELKELRGTLSKPVADSKAHYSRKEAAAYLGVGLKTLDAWAEGGQLRRAKFGDGQRARVLYRRAGLDRFVEAHLELDADGARRVARGM